MRAGVGRTFQTSTVFEGHFPGYPLMPGVLLVETMAQTSGNLLLAISDFSRMPFLADMQIPDPDIMYEGEGVQVMESAYEGLVRYHLFDGFDDGLRTLVDQHRTRLGFVRRGKATLTSGRQER